MIEAVANLPYLTNIVLKNCNLKFKHLEKLSEVLLDNQTVEHLDLSWNHIHLVPEDTALFETNIG